MRKITFFYRGITLFGALILLIIYIYLFLEKLLNKGLMVSVNSDAFFSNWIFLSIIIYANISYVRKK